MANTRMFTLAAGLFLLGGCISSTFVLTDGRATGRPHTNPGFYIDRLPPAPYYSIGIIEVKAPSGTPLDQVAAEALERGGNEGCDYVIDRAIYRVSLGIPGVRAVVAQAYPAPVTQPSTVYVTSTPPASMREFVCAIATAPGTPAPAQAAPAAGATPAVRSARVTGAVDARTAPSSAAPALANLAAGQSVQVLGAPPREGWLTIKLADGRVGYVESAAVAVVPGQ